MLEQIASRRMDNHQRLQAISQDRLHQVHTVQQAHQQLPQANSFSPTAMFQSLMERKGMQLTPTYPPLQVSVCHTVSLKLHHNQQLVSWPMVACQLGHNHPISSQATDQLSLLDNRQPQSHSQSQLSSPHPNLHNLTISNRHQVCAL